MVLGYFRRAYSIFTSKVIDVPPRLLVLMFFLLFLLFPLTSPKAYILGHLTSYSILAIFAASWDFLVGRSGQLSLGHALFFGVGAYTSGFLCQHFGLPLWITIPFGVILCVFVAFLVGFPCLRVKGPYLALVTLAFPIILLTVFLGLPAEYFGGENGLTGLPVFFPTEFFTARGFGWKEAMYQQSVAQYYLFLLFLFVSSYILYRIAYSHTGIILVSILDDEVASKASGINITKYKLMAFAISGLFGGLAGCLYAHRGRSGVAGLSTLMLTQSFMPIIVTILGGIGTIYGPIVGTYILMFLGEFVLPDVIKGLAGSMTNIGLVSFGQHLNNNITSWAGSATSPGLIFMIIVVIFIVKWPTGIARSVVDKLKDLSKERELEERGKRIWKRYKKKESPS